MALLQTLSNTNNDAFQAAWTDFFYCVEGVQQVLQESDKSSIQALINAGGTWAGGGWTTTSASKRLHDLTGIALISSDFKDYLHGFLFSLALVTGLEVPMLNLEAKAGDEAFALANLWAAETLPLGKAHLPCPNPIQSDLPGPQEERAAEAMPWDTWEEPLPSVLSFLWRRAENGEKKVDLRLLLDGIPSFTGLPVKCPENNHRERLEEPRGSLPSQRRPEGPTFTENADCSAASIERNVLG